MLRRLDDQGDDGKQFYLYRVYLRPDVLAREGWLIDPSNFVGDVELAEVCPPGVDVARYLNYHEDPGGLSLALGRGAIAATRRVAVPVTADVEKSWITSMGDDIRAANEMPPRPTWMRASRVSVTPQMHRAPQIADDLARTLPLNLRDQFRSAVGYKADADPFQWAGYVRGLLTTINDPDRVLAEIARSPLRSVA
jgi:hypothetical protein